MATVRWLDMRYTNYNWQGWSELQGLRQRARRWGLCVCVWGGGGCMFPGEGGQCAHLFSTPSVPLTYDVAQGRPVELYISFGLQVCCLAYKSSSMHKLTL
jgi:hypothetical protein